MKKILFILLFLVFSVVFTGCGSEARQTESDSAKRYPMRGEVITLDKAAKKASIKHEKIEGYMDAMTMDFEIRKPDWVWNELVPGSVVNGDLVVDNVNGAYWLEVTGIIAPKNNAQDPTPLRENLEIVGRDLVDFSLVNQDGASISPKTFKGKALAITFIYAQCPLPEFCILMSKNFSDVANMVAEDEEAKDSIRLLSISFDPARDTPEKLRRYGLGYLGKESRARDFEIWQLAVGTDDEVRKIADFAGLKYEVDKENETQFNHSLSTLVINPDGEVSRVFTGNDWKPADLVQELKKAAASIESP